MKKIIFIILILAYRVGYTQFSDQIVIDSQNEAGGITKIIVADINNDSLKDLVVSHGLFSQTKVVFYTNLGNNLFSDPQIIAQDLEDLGAPQSIAVADINGDGWVDVVAGWKFTDQVTIHINNKGSFNQTQILDDDLFAPTSLEFVDIDHDNDLDLIAIGDSDFFIYENNGEKVAQFTKIEIPPGTPTENYTLVIADIDGDSFMDIIIGGPKVLIYKNTNGVIAFDDARTDSFNDSNLTFLLHLNDFDNDGDPDVLVNNNDSSQLQWFKNNGDGFYTADQIIETNAIQVPFVTSADFDNDGNIDIIAALPQEGKIVSYKNTGNGVFNSRETVFTGLPLSTTVVKQTDINNDNNKDLIWSHPLSLHLNNTTEVDLIFSNGFDN